MDVLVPGPLEGKEKEEQKRQEKEERMKRQKGKMNAEVLPVVQ